jgi:hypothetical protein
LFFSEKVNLIVTEDSLTKTLPTEEHSVIHLLHKLQMNGILMIGTLFQEEEAIL